MNSYQRRQARRKLFKDHINKYNLEDNTGTLLERFNKSLDNEIIDYYRKYPHQLIRKFTYSKIELQ